MPSSNTSTDQTTPPREDTVARSARARAWWKWPPMAAGLLVLLVLVAYVAAFSAGFIWDDNDYVTDNLTLRSLDGLRQIWFVPRSLPQYYPLVHTTFWIEYHLWALQAPGYHVVNALLHATSALLLWRLLLRLQVPGAWLAAAIFAVHPVMVESVAWVTERKNVLSLALELGSLIAYLRFAPVDGSASEVPSLRGAWRWYFLSFALFVGALLSKTVVATLPAVILVIAWWKRGRIRLSDVMPLVPYFILGVSLGLYTAWLERYHVGAVGDDWSQTPLERVLLAGRVFWFYAAKLAWPYPLAFFYPRFVISERVAWQYLFPAAALALLGALWLARERIGRGPLAAVLIFAGVLFPALGFFNVYPFRFSFVADHFQYHASVAIIALAAAGFTILFAHRSSATTRIGYTLIGVCIAALTALTCHQSIVYHDLETLYRDTIAKNPNGWLAYLNLSTHMEKLDRFDEALELERVAVRLNPAEPAIRSNLGSTLLKLGEDNGFQPGQLEEIVAELQTALELGRDNPGFSMIAPTIHNNLSAAIVKLGKRDGFRPGQLDEVIHHLEESLRLDPRYVGAYNNLASALILINRVPDALEQLSRSLAIDPKNPDTLAGMGNALSAAGRSSEARPYFEKALAIKPAHAAAHYGLALILINEQKADEAIQHLQFALRSDPMLAEAHYALAGVLAGRNEFQQAADQYSEAVRLQPNYDRAWNNLGVMMMKLGQTDRAIDDFARAVRANPDYPDAKANLERARKVKEQGDMEQAAPGNP